MQKLINYTNKKSVAFNNVSHKPQLTKVQNKIIIVRGRLGKKIVSSQEKYLFDLKVKMILPKLKLYLAMNTN